MEPKPCDFTDSQLKFSIFQRVKCPRDFHPSEVTIFDSASNQFACAKFAKVVVTAEFGRFSQQFEGSFFTNTSIWTKVRQSRHSPSKGKTMY